MSFGMKLPWKATLLPVEDFISLISRMICMVD
jgi:hypothetical protein